MFMQVFLNDFAVSRTQADHLSHLRLCLERCHTSCLTLNPAKCAFGVTSGALLGHIEIKDGIVVDPNKIKAIVEVKTSNNAKALSHFFGKIRWQSCMICYLADFATPLHAVMHCIAYKWMTTEDKAYKALKVMLT